METTTKIIILLAIALFLIVILLVDYNFSHGVTRCMGHIKHKILIDKREVAYNSTKPKTVLFNPSIVKYHNYFIVAVRETDNYANNLLQYLHILTHRKDSCYQLWVYDLSFNLIACHRMQHNIDKFIAHEDPRVFVFKNRIFLFVTEYRTHPGVKRSIYPILHEYSFDPKNLSFTLIGEYQLVLDKSRSATQKNWCAFEHNGKILVHTDSNPTWILRELQLSNEFERKQSGKVHLKTIIEQDISNFFDPQDYPSIRCSTSWIDFTNDTYLACLHTCHGIIRGYNTVFVEISKKTLLPVKKSDRRCFEEQHNRVQFASGLTRKDDSIILSYGIDDVRFKIIALDHGDLKNILK